MLGAMQRGKTSPSFESMFSTSLMGYLYPQPILHIDLNTLYRPGYSQNIPDKGVISHRLEGTIWLSSPSRNPYGIPKFWAPSGAILDLRVKCFDLRVFSTTFGSSPPPSCVAANLRVFCATFVLRGQPSGLLCHLRVPQLTFGFFYLRGTSDLRDGDPQQQPLAGEGRLRWTEPSKADHLQQNVSPCVGGWHVLKVSF